MELQLPCLDFLYGTSQRAKQLKYFILTYVVCMPMPILFLRLYRSHWSVGIYYECTYWNLPFNAPHKYRLDTQPTFTHTPVIQVNTAKLSYNCCYFSLLHLSLKINDEVEAHWPGHHANALPNCDKTETGWQNRNGESITSLSEIQFPSNIKVGMWL